MSLEADAKKAVSELKMEISILSQIVTSGNIDEVLRGLDALQVSCEAPLDALNAYVDAFEVDEVERTIMSQKQMGVRYAREHIHQLRSRLAGASRRYSGVNQENYLRCIEAMLSEKNEVISSTLHYPVGRGHH